MGIFSKVADNGLSGCRPVVHINSQNGAIFGGDLCASQYAPDWLVGPFLKIVATDSAER